MTERAPRIYQHIGRLVDYWRANSAEVFPNLIAHTIGWGEPFCFRCGWLAPIPMTPVKTCREQWVNVGGWLERSHLQDRCSGGSDEPGNVVPLCGFCHHSMPDFTEREPAIEWVRAGQPDSCPDWWQVVTDDRWGGDRFVPRPRWQALVDIRIAAADRFISLMQAA